MPNYVKEENLYCLDCDNFRTFCAGKCCHCDGVRGVSKVWGACGYCGIDYTAIIDGVCCRCKNRGKQRTPEQVETPRPSPRPIYSSRDSSTSSDAPLSRRQQDAMDQYMIDQGWGLNVKNPFDR